MLSAILQSRMATVMMLVGFTNTGLLSLPQAMSMLLGAGVSTTLVVQVMSFKLSHVAMRIVVVGFAILSLGQLHQGLRESLETSSIHLDLLSNLKRINSQLSNIAHPIMVRAGQREA
jgi:Na+/phosphate symporter